MPQQSRSNFKRNPPKKKFTKSSQKSPGTSGTPYTPQTPPASQNTPHASQSSQSHGRTQYSTRNVRFSEENHRSDIHREQRSSKRHTQIHEQPHAPCRQKSNLTRKYPDHTDGEVDHDRDSNEPEDDKDHADNDDNDEADDNEDYSGNGSAEDVSEGLADIIVVNQEGRRNGDEGSEDSHYTMESVFLFTGC